MSKINTYDWRDRDITSLIVNYGNSKKGIVFKNNSGKDDTIGIEIKLSDEDFLNLTKLFEKHE